VSSAATAVIVFGCIFGAAVLGMTVHARLPGAQLGDDSLDVVKLVMGLIGTLAALVLGLLIASAKGTYDVQRGDVEQLSADIIQLDRTLANYGPETKETRESLRELVVQNLARIWPKESAAPGDIAPPKNPTKAEAVFMSIEALSPKTDAQTFAKSQALQIATDMFHTRFLMYAQQASGISTPMLMILVAWLVLLFLGFGLLARFNGTVTFALLIGALSVAGAIFLLLELDHPYGGLMRISSAPVQNALARIGQ